MGSPKVKMKQMVSAIEQDSRSIVSSLPTVVSNLSNNKCDSAAPLSTSTSCVSSDSALVTKSSNALLSKPQNTGDLACPNVLQPHAISPKIDSAHTTVSKNDPKIPLGNTSWANHFKSSSSDSKSFSSFEILSNMKASSSDFVEFNESELQDLRKPWFSSLIGRFLMKSPPHFQVRDWACTIWSSYNISNVIDLENGFFLFHFSFEEDAVKGYLINLRPRKPNFKALTEELSSALVWIQLPDLPMEYWQNSNLFCIASLVGKPIKVDEQSFSWLRGKFVRIYVDLDFSKPLKQGFWIEKPDSGIFQAIRYERLPVFCFKCGIIGHNIKDYAVTNPAIDVSLPASCFDKFVIPTKDRTLVSSNSDENNSIYDPWIKVTRKGRNFNRPRVFNAGFNANTDSFTPDKNITQDQKVSFKSNLSEEDMETNNSFEEFQLDDMENDDSHLVQSKVENSLFSYNEQHDLDSPPLVNIPIKVVASLTRENLENQILGNDINLPSAKEEDKNKDKVVSIAPSFSSFVKRVSSTLGNAEKSETNHSNPVHSLHLIAWEDVTLPKHCGGLGPNQEIKVHLPSPNLRLSELPVFNGLKVHRKGEGGEAHTKSLLLFICLWPTEFVAVARGANALSPPSSQALRVVRWPALASLSLPNPAKSAPSPPFSITSCSSSSPSRQREPPSR
ncbi:hypothetical protein Cni_G13412 [Canna indica]|uniref:DUF4283 domain-containing protein n=1 Tax=Canna indica TaxID=4628 RepID=A0AAQ3KA22_9LILI|nr:hypothetical protein Cni_G13412 [Canna indica]